VRRSPGAARPARRPRAARQRQLSRTAAGGQNVVPLKRRKQLGCESGPLIVGAGEGDASGAGIRLPTGASGVGGAKRVVARA
jgi:hypothetical protein